MTGRAFVGTVSGGKFVDPVSGYRYGWTDEDEELAADAGDLSGWQEVGYTTDSITLTLAAQPDPEALELLFGVDLASPPQEPTYAVVIDTKDERPAEPRRPVRKPGLRGWWAQRKALVAYYEEYARWLAKGAPETETVILRTYIPRAMLKEIT